MAQLGVALAAGAPWECCPTFPRVTSITDTLSAAPLVSLGREEVLHPARSLCRVPVVT